MMLQEDIFPISSYLSILLSEMSNVGTHEVVLYSLIENHGNVKLKLLKETSFELD